MAASLLSGSSRDLLRRPGGAGQALPAPARCFALAAVSAPVHVCHGVRDALVPLDHALAPASPAAAPGRFLFRRRLADVLGAVTGAGHVSGAGTTASR
jgi:fermentation-respiration switch protein FrsA (DUF1100 family)